MKTVVFVLSLFLLLFVTNHTGVAAKTKTFLMEKQSLDRVISIIQEDKLYDAWTTLECLSILVEERTEEYFVVTIREKHEGKCPGNRLTAPFVDSFRIYRGNGKLGWVIVLVVLVATVLISSILVIYSAPTILAEAAFQGVLASSLVKKARKISEESWAESILKATWKPFAVTLGVAFIGGAILHGYYPHAAKLADILFRG